MDDPQSIGRSIWLGLSVDLAVFVDFGRGALVGGFFAM